MTNLPYLFAAYGAIWVAVFLFVLSLSMKGRRLEREVKELKELLIKQGEKSEQT